MDLPRQEAVPKHALRAGYTPAQAHNASLSPEAYVSGIKNKVGCASAMVSETTEWDVYNNEAKKVDAELIKDWSASLNFLLLFLCGQSRNGSLSDIPQAAIFAAVLSAFIIESKKLLEPDSASIIADVLIFYTNNAANGTHVPYYRDEFHPTAEAITINCLLLGSLSLSIVAALGSVVALQWVADYDAAITRGGSSPEDHARRRQFRFGGVINWRMSEIIAALPLFLHLSVLLFFAGVIQWMRTLNTTVGNVVLAGAATTAIFYLSTTLFAVLFASAPFNTPLSRGMESLLQLPTILEHLCTLLLSRIRSNAKSNTRRYVHPPKREDMIVRSNTKLASQALTWVATVINVSPNSCRRPFLLVGGILRLPSVREWSEVLSSASWIHIIDDVARKHLNRSTNATVTEEDIQEFSILMKVFENKRIRAQITPSNYSEEEELFRGEIDQSANGAFLLLHGLPSPSAVDMRTLILLSRWRYAGRPLRMWDTILDHYCEEPALPYRPRHPNWPQMNVHPAGGFTVLVDYFCKFIENLKTDSGYTVESVINDFIDVGLTKEVTFEAACMLVRAFEFCVAAMKIEGPRKGVFSNFDLYLSLLEERHIDHHYKLLELLTKTVKSAPEKDQERYAREIITTLCSGPAYTSKKTWKDVCRSDEIPVVNDALASASGPNDVKCLLLILRRVALDMRDMIGDPGKYHLYDPMNSFGPRDVERLIEQIYSELEDRGFQTSDLGPKPPREKRSFHFRVTGKIGSRETHTAVATSASSIDLIYLICGGVSFFNTNELNLEALAEAD